MALGLSRIQPVAVRLGVLSWDCPVITVAGTNGKGSCVAITTAILQAAGYRCGSYTSPHLLRYNERIGIAGQTVTDIDLCTAFAEIETVRQDMPLTYFEFGTLAALWLFKQAQLDVIVLEVGLGGRLDAVNIVDADIAIISSVDLDHMDWLGETREQIAWEKAGILRAAKPCIWGDEIVPSRIQAYAQRLKAPLYVQNRDFGIADNATTTWTGWGVSYRFEQLPKPPLHLPNAACVLQAIALLQARLPVTFTAIQQGLQQVFLPGRFHIIPGPVTTILDVAHNPASTRLLAQRFATLPTQGRKLAVVGMLTTKDIPQSLAPLVQQIDHWFVGSLAVAKAASAAQLANCLRELNVLSSSEYSTIPAAFKAAQAAASPEDHLLVFGSFHTVAAVMAQL